MAFLQIFYEIGMTANLSRLLYSLSPWLANQYKSNVCSIMLFLLHTHTPHTHTPLHTHTFLVWFQTSAAWFQLLMEFNNSKMENIRRSGADNDFLSILIMPLLVKNDRARGTALISSCYEFPLWESEWCVEVPRKVCRHKQSPVP